MTTPNDLPAKWRALSKSFSDEASAAFEHCADELTRALSSAVPDHFVSVLADARIDIDSAASAGRCLSNEAVKRILDRIDIALLTFVDYPNNYMPPNSAELERMADTVTSTYANGGKDETAMWVGTRLRLLARRLAVEESESYRDRPVLQSVVGYGEIVDGKLMQYSHTPNGAAVPLPVMQALGWRKLTPSCEHPVMGYTEAQMVEYGDAREAAARGQQSEPAGSEAAAEMVTLLPFLPPIPRRILDAAATVEDHMRLHHPGPWSLFGIQSVRGTAHPVPQAHGGEAFAWYAPTIEDTCTHAKKMQRERDGVGSAALFTVPLYTRLSPVVDVEALQLLIDIEVGCRDDDIEIAKARAGDIARRLTGAQADA